MKKIIRSVIWAILITLLVLFVALQVILFFIAHQEDRQLQQYLTTKSYSEFDGKKKIVIPLHYQSGYLTITALFAGNEEPQTCILDTGASPIAWPQQYHFATTVEGKESTMTNGDGLQSKSQFSSIQEVRIGGLTVHNVPSYEVVQPVIESNSITPEYKYPIIGNLTFAHTIYEVDSRHGKLTLYPPDSPPLAPEGGVLLSIAPARIQREIGLSRNFTGGNLIVPGSIEGVPASICIDSGDPNPGISMSKGFFQKLQRNGKTFRVVPIPNNSYISARIDSVTCQIGTLKGTTTTFISGQPKGLSSDTDIGIGPELFNKYRVTVDNLRHQVRLVPYPNADSSSQ